MGTLFFLRLPVSAEVAHAGDTGSQHQCVHDVGHTGLAAVKGSLVSTLGDVAAAAAFVAVLIGMTRVLGEVQL